MLHRCPSCRTRCAVSPGTAPERVVCPRCGEPLGASDEPTPSGRTTIVLVAFAACLLLPLAVALPILFVGDGEPEPPPPAAPQVAWQDTAPRQGLPHDFPGRHGQPADPPTLPPVLLEPSPAPAPLPKDSGPRLDPVPLPPLDTNLFPTLPAEPPRSDGKGEQVMLPTDPKQPAPQAPPKKPDPLPKGNSMGQKVTFLGAVGTGRRFCIIADNSGSMTGTPLQVLKYELGRTLQSIQANNEFYVIFFNSKATPQPTPGWLRGVTGPPQVWPWIQALEAGGTTKPLTGFEVAFQLNPRPDAIFFMTDGIIPPDVPQAVLTMNNRGQRVPIHTILFTRLNLKSPPQAIRNVVEPLQVIAVQSGGTFSAVPVPPSPPQMPQPLPRPPKK